MGGGGVTKKQSVPFCPYTYILLKPEMKVPIFKERPIWGCSPESPGSEDSENGPSFNKNADNWLLGLDKVWSGI